MRAPAYTPANSPFLQDLSSLDAGYDEEGGGTDDSSSTSGAADGKPWLELRCVLAVIRHGDRTPKQKMKVTVTQVGTRLVNDQCCSPELGLCIQELAAAVSIIG